MMSIQTKKILDAAGVDESTLRNRLTLACQWLLDIAQLKSEDDPVEKRHRQLSWAGAIKGEYSPAEGKWRFFCPIWHTGQAVKALVMACQATKDTELLEGATKSVDFILRNTVETEEAAQSLMLAYEDYPDKINTSAILECLDGLRVFNEFTKHHGNDTFLQASEWVIEQAWLKGDGLFMDLYDPVARAFISKAYGDHVGRPLLDDGILLHAYHKSGKRKFRDAFFETADRLLQDEYPSGNWVNFTPCQREAGIIHPRHAYWWGYPMFLAWQESGERKYLDCALRSCRWYARAQRRDGGLIRNTGLDFNTDSFGHSTSGTACAMIMYITANKITGDDEFLPSLAKALEYCLKMQFVDPRDENLRGCILEKVLPPDGTDRSPYHIRDLGTIFFIQAVAKILE